MEKDKKLRFRKANFEGVKEKILGREFDEKTIFNFLNAYSVYLFRKHPNFRKKILKDNNLNFIDAFTVSVILSIKNIERVRRLKVPDFTRRFLCDPELNKNKKHLFVGIGKERGRKILKKFSNLKEKNVVFYQIPFIKKYRYDDSELIEIINEWGPDYIWVGIGNPKQEILSNDFVNRINRGYIFNVGAAFDYLIGRKERAPKIWQNLGLEWLYRLITDFNHTKKKAWRSLIGSWYGLGLIELEKE